MDGTGVNLTFEVDRNADVTVVRCRGVVAAGLTDHLDTLVGKLIPHNRLILIDLGEVTSADSKGVEILARLFQDGARSGCHVKVINADKHLGTVPGLLNLQMAGARSAGRRALPA